MVKAVIFDCFGVLVGKGFEYTYRLAGGNPKTDKVFIDDTLSQANLGMISHEEFNQAITDHLGVAEQAWRQAMAEAESPDAQLLDYIAGLRDKYKTAILSNAGRGVMPLMFGEQTLQHCFDEVIVSADVGLVKPDPRIYELAAKKLGFELNECVFIDDKQSFLDSANELGMKTILYKSYDQLIEDLEAVLKEG